MKILMINVVCGTGSTGRICTDLAMSLKNSGHQVKIAYGRGKIPEQFEEEAVKIGTTLDTKLHGLKARIMDGAGFGSKGTTEKFVRWINEYNPDIIHLHNLHGYYINVKVLFDYLKISNKKIIWTLHDCWPFTGHCTYFDFVKCDEWRMGCKSCVQKQEYPACYGIGFCGRNYKLKKAIFSDVPNMVIVSPSKWLEELVRESFLKPYNVKVITNGIDCNVFQKRRSNLREEYGLNNRKIILGVAAEWNKRKGLNHMISLAKRTKEQVVVIGVSRKQKKELPDNMIGILRTSDMIELAQWYSEADVYVNPTLEDNYPTTNLESIACGTPVVTFATGGSIESASLYGAIVPKGDDDELYKMVTAVLDEGKKNKKIDVSKENMLNSYLHLYNEL